MFTGQTETHYDAERKIWSGRRVKEFYGPHLTLGEVADVVLGRDPDKMILVQDTTGEKLTAGQLLRYGKVMARSLIRIGLKPGDVVGISASNTTYLGAVVLGAFLCGTPTNALYPEFDRKSVEVIFAVTQPKVIFCDVENYDIIREAAAGLGFGGEIFVINGEKEGVRNVNELLVDDGAHLDMRSFPCADMTGDDTAVILCSSGTTGPPKGVQCSHSSLINQTRILNIQGNSVLFTFSTMYWASGLWIFVNSLLNGAQCVWTNRASSAEYFLALVERYGITDVITGPSLMAELLQHATPTTTRQRLTSIRCIVCGGSKVPQVVMAKMNALLGDEKRTGFTVAYGMSELSGLFTLGYAEPGRDPTEGKLIPNVEARIESETTGELLGINEQGALHVRSPYKWSGYYRNPEATQKAYIDGGWLVTGDIGFFDSDGFLHICARNSDVFKSSNFQIYPSHIEDVVMEVPGVLEACVFGVPDFVAIHLTGCAVVRTDNEQGERIREQDILDHVEERMAAIYHLKAGVFFMESLPKTGSGKIQRRKVLDMIQGQNRRGLK